jgi:hypothetical protein
MNTQTSAKIQNLLVYSAHSFHANPNVHEVNKRLPFYWYALLVCYSIFIPKLSFLFFCISALFTLSTNACDVPRHEEAMETNDTLPACQHGSWHGPQASSFMPF